MSNPVLTGTDNATWPVVIPAGQWSPWITAIGSDPDAMTVTGDLQLFDASNNPSNIVPLSFTFPDPLTAQLTFAAGVPQQVEYDPLNPLRFRVRNTNV
jgi:hypothetical protein